MPQHQCRGPPRELEYKEPYVDMSLHRRLMGAYVNARSEARALDRAQVGIEEWHNPMIIPSPEEAEAILRSVSFEYLPAGCRREMEANLRHLYADAVPLAEFASKGDDRSLYVLHNPIRVMFADILRIASRLGGECDLASPASPTYREVLSAVQETTMLQDAAHPDLTEDNFTGTGQLLRALLPPVHDQKMCQQIVPVSKIGFTDRVWYLAELAFIYRYSGQHSHTETDSLAVLGQAQHLRPIITNVKDYIGIVPSALLSLSPDDCSDLDFEG